ncbi:hypothetical protein D9600_13220 [Deinococcus sp. DB0503]|nr:hypothetical protein [Deinococcus sp. DB0503]
MNSLDETMAADATRLLIDVRSLPVAQGPRAVLEGAVDQAFLEPERKMWCLLDRAAAPKQWISPLVGEYQTLHEPWQEGSLLSLIL